jgi:chitinase
MHVPYLFIYPLIAQVALASRALSREASPHPSQAQTVVYWGQNSEANLSTYCESTSGIDILVLSFLYEYGNGNNIASGTIGQCYISPSGEGQCQDLAAAIDICKAKGIKIILSLGGGNGAYSLQSQEQAQTIGQNLWDAYGNAKGSGSVPRPFGTTFVNGWDFDIESNSGNQYYRYMISTLRANFASDSSNNYYITGAPQCQLPERNMGEMITDSKFDYLWVQFYNNPECFTNGEINYGEWKTFVANTSSVGAKLFIGVAASPQAGSGYLEPSALATLVEKNGGDSAFGGVMMWSAGFSDANVNNGCTFA